MKPEHWRMGTISSGVATLAQWPAGAKLHPLHILMYNSYP